MTPKKQSIIDANSQYPEANPTTLARLIVQNNPELWGSGHATIDNVRRHVGRYRAKLGRPSQKTKAPPTENDLLNDRRDELNHRQESKRIQTLQDEVLALQSKIDTINNVFAADLKPIVPTLAKSESETTAVALASDWHVEEPVSPKQVNELNEYSMEMAELRSEVFFIKIVKLVDLWRAGTTINTLVLALLGDFITGYIHEENKKTNKVPPTVAANYACGLLRKGFQYLLKHGGFTRIVVPCCVGNHGRTTDRMSFSTRDTESFEMGIYATLAQEFQADPVEFMLPVGYLQYLDVYGRLLRFHHGDAIKYKDGVGGMTIPVNKRIASWDRSRKAYLDCFGHLHTLLPADRFIANGSLIGYNAFAVGCGLPFQKPGQALFFIEKDHGLTSYNPIWID